MQMNKMKTKKAMKSNTNAIKIKHKNNVLIIGNQLNLNSIITQNKK
jgi:hypothetical protein